MEQALLPAHGAQPIKPSRYKPVWTDRFFTGLVTNRNPLRSPLSAFYATGWQLGKTDTLINGANVEISSRLTLVKRPGCTSFGSAVFSNPPQALYSFHSEDGNINLIYDDGSQVGTFNPTSKNPFFTKQSGAGVSRFLGIGTQLYWGDGLVTAAWNEANQSAGFRQMGIVGPQSAPVITSITPVTGSAATIHGASLNGSNGYVSTANQIANPTTFSFEGWMYGSSPNTALASFESSQTGSSSTVYHAIYLNASGVLCYAVRDTSGNINVFNEGGNVLINDNNWHHIVVEYTYASTLSTATTVVNGTTIKSAGIGASNYTPDPATLTNFSYTSQSALSAVGTKNFSAIYIYVDGQLIWSWGSYLAPASGNGYWRLGECSGWSGQAFSTNPISLSDAVIYSRLLPGVGAHYAQMMLTSPGVANFESLVAASSPTYWWKLTETSGTTAADSAGTNTGTYQGTVTLNFTAPVIYLTYAISTAYSYEQYVIDSNGNIQQVSTPGTSGSSAPPWATNIGATTHDGTVVWINRGSAALTLTTGTQYCYSYVNLYGHFSTASPLSNTTGPQSGVKIAMSVVGSADPQVTGIAIFRTPDGGSTPFYVNTIPNPSPVPGVTTTTYTDTVTESNLNILIPAPQAHSNDAPPQGLTNFTYHLGRVWGSVGGTLYASGGPDTVVGDGNESFPPANNWQLTSQITRLVSTTSGLLAFTTDGIYLVAGGPAISQFYVQLLFDRIGLLNFYALDTNGSQITLFTADRQLLMIDPSTGFTDVGFPIADILLSISPQLAVVAHHHNGTDHGVYIGDGKHGWYRGNAQQPPDYSITGPVWSPFAGINNNNCGLFQSLETSPGTYNLMIAQHTGSGPILYRNAPSPGNDSVSGAYCTDNGVQYGSSATIGSIVLAAPGELAELGFLTIEGSQGLNQYNPTVSVLIDELFGTFSPLSTYVADPPVLYGISGGQTSMTANRYYFKQTSFSYPALCRHLQIEINFGNNNIANTSIPEIMSMTLYGSIYEENS